MAERQKFYAYRHTNGTMHLKRYIGPDDLSEATQSIHVVKVTDAFEAESVDHARKIGTQLLRASHSN